MVNCIPVFIASTEYWGKRFAEKHLPIIGDDIKSQVGATILHRVLTSLFVDRGVRLDHTYQLNFGGNTDFMNMLERERLESKKISKTGAVTSMLPYKLDPDDIHVGPSDYVPWLKDRKFCYIKMEGTTFGDVPLNLELKLEVWDSPNSAGVVIDAVRCVKLGLDRGLAGPLIEPASYFMISSPTRPKKPDDHSKRIPGIDAGRHFMPASRLFSSSNPDCSSNDCTPYSYYHSPAYLHPNHHTYPDSPSTSFNLHNRPVKSFGYSACLHPGYLHLS